MLPVNVSPALFALIVFKDASMSWTLLPVTPEIAVVVMFAAVCAATVDDTSTCVQAVPSDNTMSGGAKATSGALPVVGVPPSLTTK